jgi:Zn finger protein HypA/HybF involved in hydrogenase expression
MITDDDIKNMLKDYDKRIREARFKTAQKKYKCNRCGKKIIPENSGNRLCEKCNHFAVNSSTTENYLHY